MAIYSDSSVAPTSLPTGDWHIDPTRSQVHFHTRAMFGLFPVLGRFESFAGVLHVDDAGEATGEMRIEAGSIRTGIARRDAHLRTADFFHAQAHPRLTFDLLGLQPDGDGRQVTGTLRIRDEVLPIRAHASVTRVGPELRIHARLPIDHDAAGLGWAKPGMVRKVVEADLDLTLVGV